MKQFLYVIIISVIVCCCIVDAAPLNTALTTLTQRLRSLSSSLQQASPAKGQQREPSQQTTSSSSKVRLKFYAQVAGSLKEIQTKLEDIIKKDMLQNEKNKNCTLKLVGEQKQLPDKFVFAVVHNVPIDSIDAIKNLIVDHADKRIFPKNFYSHTSIIQQQKTDKLGKPLFGDDKNPVLEKIGSEVSIQLAFEVAPFIVNLDKFKDQLASYEEELKTKSTELLWEIHLEKKKKLEAELSVALKDYREAKERYEEALKTRASKKKLEELQKVLQQADILKNQLYIPYLEAVPVQLIAMRNATHDKTTDVTNFLSDPFIIFSKKIENCEYTPSQVKLDNLAKQIVPRNIEAIFMTRSDKRVDGREVFEKIWPLK